MGPAIRAILSGLLIAASTLLGALAEDAPPQTRNWLLAGMLVGAFLGTALTIDGLLRARQRPVDPVGPGRSRSAVGTVLRGTLARLSRLGTWTWGSLARAARPTGWRLGSQLRDLLRPIAWRMRGLLGIRLGTLRIRPRMLPPRLSTFRGRTKELNHLLDRHRETRGPTPSHGFGLPVHRRRWRPRLAETGPLLYVIYGMPAVGKSVLAQEFAHCVQDWYPDGQFYDNLGSAGSSRSVGEVLRRWLVALGWPMDEMPPDADERAKIFRSLTNDCRMLFVLDAARDPDQVLDLMPTGPGCTVVVTSRRDLGPAVGADETIALGAPAVGEALELLSAYIPTQSGEPIDPECAVRVVEQVGRLPGALRSVGERVSVHRVHVCSVAEMLRAPRTRLAMLETDGRNVRGRIETEYARLDPPEKEALRYLTLVRAETFVPWVASVLLGIDVEEAEDRVAQLGVAQLLHPVGRDEVTGLDRYAFHPLVRLFAAKQLDAVEGYRAPAVAEARQRLDKTTLYVAGLVLTKLEPDFRVPGLSRFRPRWMPDDSDMPDRIADRPLPWIRAEYRHLLHALKRASQEGWSPMAWRLAALLGACVPEPSEFDSLDPNRDAESDIADTIEAFNLGLRAAELDRDEFGRIKAMLAKSSFLIAVERYGDAVTTTNHAREAAQMARDAAAKVAEDAILAGNLAAADSARRQRTSAQHLETSALRQLGEAYLQMGARAQAARELDQAHALADECGERTETLMIDLLRAETHGFDSGAAKDALDADDNRVKFAARLVKAEEARRVGDWPMTREHLVTALALASDDARRTASVLYRLARLSLDRRYRRQPEGTGGGPVDDPAGYLNDGVTYAARALLTFQRMGNPVGEVRARCLLVRTLTAAGRLTEAEVHCARAAAALRALPASAAPATRPLTARLRRAQGELLMEQGNHFQRVELLERARARLTGAAHLLDELGDWRFRDDTLQLRDGSGQYQTGPSGGRRAERAAPNGRGPSTSTVPLAVGVPRPRADAMPGGPTSSSGLGPSVPGNTGQRT